MNGIIKLPFGTILLTTLFIASCNNGTVKNTPAHPSISSDKRQELIKKIDGEWAVQNDWRDSILTFSDIRHKNFKQEIFPSYNTIVFNQKNKTVEVNTYGEFGDGTSAVQNLNISNSKWSFEKGLLKLKFDYSNYSGQHHLESTYSIERTAQKLILKQVK